MSFINVISALGNNNSVYPLLVRDCGIENVAKCVLTYKQNAKDDKFIARQATIERAIDEYGTSAVWLGGIPLMEKFCDKIIKKCGYSPKVSTKLLEETKEQGLEANLKKFQNIAPKEVLDDLKKVKDNKNTFKSLQIGKLIATTAIPIAIMGFVLPKLNFAYTKKRIEQEKTKNKNKIEKQNQSFSSLKAPNIDEYIDSKRNKISFTGLNSLLNITQLQKMMILDGGLSVGRVKTGRNKSEKAELGFKMAGMCFLNYVAPKYIDKGLNFVTKKLFGLNVDLDPKLLSDKNFLESIKNNTLALPDVKSETTIINFVDKNMDSVFVDTAKNLNLISSLDNNVRDPRKFVDTNKLKDLSNRISSFASDAIKSGDVDKFASKALKAKSFNILANVVLSSFLLAIMLPKAQFAFRKLITGSDLEPGIAQNQQKTDNKEIK